MGGTEAQRAVQWMHLRYYIHTHIHTRRHLALACKLGPLLLLLLLLMFRGMSCNKVDHGPGQGLLPHLSRLEPSHGVRTNSLDWGMPNGDLRLVGACCTVHYKNIMPCYLLSCTRAQFKRPTTWYLKSHIKRYVQSCSGLPVSSKPGKYVRCRWPPHACGFSEWGSSTIGTYHD